MSDKVIVEIYYTFGKGDGAELNDRFLIEDTPEEREAIIEEVYYDDLYGSKEEFINGTINSIDFSKYGGDWDDPTGGHIIISTKEEYIKVIEEAAKREIEEIEYMYRSLS